MNTVTIILTALVVVEFVYIFVLETLMTSSERTAKTFGLDQADLANPAMNVSLKNQGVYNLGIAALLLLGLILNSTPLVAGVLVYVVFVAAYGSLTVSRDIIFKQGGIALIALIMMLVL